MTYGTKFYIADGKEMYIKHVDTARFVTPSRGNRLAHVGARLAKSSRLGIDTGVSANCLVVRGDANKLKEISNYEDIENTRSVFMDKGGRELILTNDILVKFSNTITYDNRLELCRKLNCIVIDDKDDVWKIRAYGINEDEPLDIANKLCEEKNVIFAEPDMIQSLEHLSLTLPTDPLLSNQWYLKNDGQHGGVPGADVNAQEAWSYTYGSPNIRVVVHDSGLDMNHPDLKFNIESGWDFDNGDSYAHADIDPFDTTLSYAHGTACAGIIAASHNNLGIVGIAPNCKIVPLKATRLSWSEWAETFNYAATHGDIISCSWNISQNDIISDAIRRAATEGRNGKGTPIFCATGNDYSYRSNSIDFPASHDSTIGVGSSTNKDDHCRYSQGGLGIDFVAPSCGEDLGVETTDIQGSYGYNKQPGIDGDYCKAHGEGISLSGTSYSTPLVAGVAALMLSVNPNLTSKETRKILRDTAVKIDFENGDYDYKGWSQKYGYGRIDAGKAVEAARSLL